MSYIWAQQRDLDVLLKYESCPPLYEVTAFYNLTILVKDAISFAFACRPGMSSRFVLHEKMRHVVSALRH